MSLVFYNGVTLPYPLTTSFRTTALYDDESHTDWYATQFDIAWTFLVNIEYAGMLYPDLALLTDNPATIMLNIRNLLMQPRRPFSYSFNGIDLIPASVAAGQGYVDAANGPQPQYCEYSQMSETMFFLSYAIRAVYWENPGDPNVFDGRPAAQQGNPVLFNRWTETVDIDNRNFTTRSRNGRYRMRSDNRDGNIVDRYREQLAVLGKPAGFIRKSAQYTVSPDGLSLSYNVVDVETYKSYPFPAFEADGEYTESTSKLGSILHGEVRVHLRGSKKADPGYSFGSLIQTAVGVAASKMQINGANLFRADIPDPRNRGTLEYTTLQISLYDSDVEVRMRARFPVRHPGRVEGIMFTPDRARVWPVTPGSTVTGLGLQGPGINEGWRPNLDIRGNEAAYKVLQAAAYYDPNIIANNAMDPATGQMQRGAAPGANQFGLGG